ncbi:hypothetical protein GC175_15755 [bacterium]|nr:hypothetical protein [bacterium]
MLTIARTLTEATSAHGEYRAGGTDVQERRNHSLSFGPIVDISRLSGYDAIEWNEDGSALLGALVTQDTLATDKRLRDRYPGIAQAAGGLATPQIRWMSTLGGALLQRTRCPYFRHPAYSCVKSGGEGCPARDGWNPNGVVFDLGPCVYPHPSTLGMALLAYEAEVEINDGERRSIANLYGDGSDGSRDHTLAAQEVLTRVYLPVPVDGERTAYFRSISRAEAEWPIVECLVRLVIADGVITFARVGVGGVANIPLRLENVEAALTGQPSSVQALTHAASLAAEGTRPLAETAYKVDFLVGTVLEALERAVGD